MRPSKLPRKRFAVRNPTGQHVAIIVSLLLLTLLGSVMGDPQRWVYGQTSHAISVRISRRAQVASLQEHTTRLTRDRLSLTKYRLHTSLTVRFLVAWIRTNGNILTTCVLGPPRTIYGTVSVPVTRVHRNAHQPPKCEPPKMKLLSYTQLLS